MRVAVVLADGGAIVPATVTALALGSLNSNGKLLALGQLNIGDDVELGQVDGLVAGQQRIHLGGNDRLDADLLALGEGAGRAGILKGLGHGATELERSLEHALELIGLVDRDGRLVPIEQRGVLLMIDAAGGRIGHGLVDRVGQDRLQIAHEHREELGEHGLSAAALERAGLFAVQTVLQGVEVHVGKLGNNKVVERTVGARELVAGVGIVDLGLDLGQAGNHELVERQQVGKGDAVGLGLKLTLELGEQEAQRVAETTVGIGRTSENLVVDGNVRAGVDRGNPQADDVGAHLVADLVGVDDVAERLGHLAALTVEREALRDDRLVRSMAVGAGTCVTAEAQGNNLDFYALNVKNDLTVNGTLNATTKGCVYQNDYPVALLVGGTLRVVGGQVTATSDGQNGNDGCQGYGIKANVLEIGGGGSVRAYSNGYSTKTSQYDGKEAIYVSSNLTVDLGGYLYAKTQNPILSNENENGALKVNGRWDLSGTNGDTAYTKAVITKPVNGSIYKNVILETTVSPEKEVEISGIRNAVLVLGYNEDQNNKGKTWYYRNADRPGDTDSVKQNVYSSGSTQQELNLKEGFSRVLASDYNNYYGIDVREGEHTVVLDGLAIVRDHTFLTVRSGATLNLKLTGKSYLKSGSAPAIYVEQGGTLNLIGGGMAQSSLALMGGLSAASGATVNFKDCAVYAAGKTIGGTGANVSVENCWISAGFAGNLRVTRSTLEGEHSGGTVKIDRRSNANLTDASGKAVTGVTDHSGNPVYRTKVELEDMNQSRNLMMIAYRTNATSGTMQSTFYPLVTQLRVNIPNIVNDDIIKDLTMLVGSNTVYLWLPNGTRIMSVEGFQDDGSSPVGFIHDPQKGAPIITTADNNASGKMILLSLLLASGVLAFRGTPGGDNTALCAGYLGDSAKDTWIGYHPEKDVKLQADWKFITDFGIRMLTGGEAEVKLNGLDLSGPNKRVELDDRSKLSIVLMENTESVMRSNEGSTDAVWTLKGSGGLTIKGQSGGEKLTLRGDHAMDGSTGASLTFDGITLINNCTNKPETTLGKLTISNSTVLGLGTVNCANVVINGGSVDLDVPVNTVVKDSGGNELKKVTLTLSQKNTAVEDVTLSGLPAGTAFNDSHVTTDGSGKLYLWIPKDAEVETVTVGGNKYYPKSDGSMTIGDVPEFTSPTEDVSCVVESSEYMTLTVEVTGTPAPALQWQVSRDGGNTWENIEGATEATYQAILPLSLHGAKFRCAATNKDGTTYSHTFTSYYCPAYLRGAASPMRGNGEFIPGEIATITAGFYDNSTWYPVSSLTGVTAKYRWKYCRNVMPTEEEWAAIPPAGESYPITITDEMDYQSVCFHVTLTYPGNTVKTVTGYWRLNVCVTPVVTEQPQSVSAAAGDSVTFSAKLIDQYLNTLEYQWQSSTDGGQNWTDIEGASGISHKEGYWNYIPSYTIPSVTAAQSGQLFRCVLWNTNNHTGSDRVSTPPVYSEPATLTVTPPAHEHRYGDWSKDGTNHWHECTDAACPNQSESIKDKAAHVYDDDADATCNICGYVRTVTPEIVPVSQITLNKAEASISVGNSEKLTATVTPENAANKALTWASSDEDVATVAPDGTVTAVKAGAATITATAADGSGKSATCTVTVTGGTTPSQPAALRAAVPADLPPTGTAMTAIRSLKRRRRTIPTALPPRPRPGETAL